MKILPTWFGIDKLYVVAGKTIGYRFRTKDHESFFLFLGKKPVRIWKRKLPFRFDLTALRNDSFDAANLFELSKVESGKKSVLFVLDELQVTGGVERRLVLQFEWLAKHGIQPIIVAHKQNYAPLSRYPHLRFIDSAINAEQKLVDLIRWSGAVTVEFNMKNTRLFNEIDINMLKRFARIGCMIHGDVEVAQEQLDKLDYRCCSTTVGGYQNVEKIPNVVNFPTMVPEYDVKARKALYIGRIDQEKLPTVQNFVWICRKYGFAFEIAGPVQISQKRVAAFAKEVGPSAFIGVIDSRVFLSEKGGSYAFIGGVGQVPLEAAAANLPALVATHLDDPNRSAFLAPDTFETLLESNCVVTQKPGCLMKGNLDEFFKIKEKAENLDQIDAEVALARFRLRDHLKAFRDAEAVWQRYRSLLLG